MLGLMEVSWFSPLFPLALPPGGFLNLYLQLNYSFLLLCSEFLGDLFYSGNSSFIVSFCFSKLSLPCTVPFPLKLLFCVCFDLFYVRVFL